MLVVVRVVRVLKKAGVRPVGHEECGGINEPEHGDEDNFWEEERAERAPLGLQHNCMCEHLQSRVVH